MQWSKAIPREVGASVLQGLGSERLRIEVMGPPRGPVQHTVGGFASWETKGHTRQTKEV